jgi:hypothetical protein
MIYFIIFLLMGVAAWISYDIGNDDTKPPSKNSGGQF